MRKRIMNYGPTIRTPRLGMQLVSVRTQNARRGVFLRMPPSVQYNTVVKSEMGRATQKGIREPGYQAPNYIRPLS